LLGRSLGGLEKWLPGLLTFSIDVTSAETMVGWEFAAAGLTAVEWAWSGARLPLVLC
jgi:hypothetical protein